MVHCVDSKPLEQFCVCLVISVAIRMRSVAAGILLISLAVYLYLFVCLLTACFRRNKDAHIYNGKMRVNERKLI